ncbi:MAG TPA: hypothetical protein VNT03_05825 [Baekduia sp.]|nr:hypothetical protein [Baekduia sp.]
MRRRANARRAWRAAVLTAAILGLTAPATAQVLDPGASVVFDVQGTEATSAGGGSVHAHMEIAGFSGTTTIDGSWIIGDLCDGSARSIAVNPQVIPGTVGRIGGHVEWRGLGNGRDDTAWAGGAEQTLGDAGGTVVFPDPDGGTVSGTYRNGGKCGLEPDSPAWSYSASFTATYHACGALPTTRGPTTSCCRPEATRAGGCTVVAKIAPVAPVLRGATAHLDGTGSTGPITSYRWSYALASSCPHGAKPAPGAGGATGQQTITMLCAVRATLTVTGASNTSTAHVLVHVRPRAWTTTVTNTQHIGRPPVDDTFTTPSRDVSHGRIIGGVNRCPDGGTVGTGGVFCPPAGEGLSGLYSTAAVADPGGPFDDWSYVATTSLPVDRVAYINPEIAPGSAFYTYNLKVRHKPMARWFEAIGRHEGWGNGAPRSGHSQAIRDAIVAHHRHDDPTRYLETVVRPPGTSLETAANACLTALDHAIRDYAKDPLTSPAIHGMTFYEYTPSKKRWLPFTPPVPRPGRHTLGQPHCADP